MEHHGHFPTDRLSRRRFLQTTGAAVGGAMLANPFLAHAAAERLGNKMRVALVGTGVRGVAMFGRDLLRSYGDYVEMVGICEKNPGRLRVGFDFIGADCPVFLDLEEMLVQTKPEWLIVATWDWEHHNCIELGMRHGAHIICEKPITIDEVKAQMILDAQRRYGREVTVTHNYRYPPHRAKVKELLMEGAIGDIISIDLHWNISHPHLQQYMQRWHGHRERGGSLWVHKATHHFDLVNWWLDSDPVEVFAYGDLERFGAQGPFRGENCRNCAFTSECDYHWDITQNEHLYSLYTQNEHHDGYVRDNCVFRETIDIFDKHSAVVKYANNAYLSYSLTGEETHEGFWLAVNGTKGRLEGKEGGVENPTHHEWHLTVRGRGKEVIRMPFERGGHWGGDPLMMDMLFKDPSGPDPLHQRASARDGIMSILVGTAARKSIDTGMPVRIEELTELEPMTSRPRF
ncbi:MAG: Gfo/Idh/MocA family oxidoreductase [Rhodothermales bacterium]